MTKPTALVTGARGEMGHLLVPALVERGYDVVALDLEPLSPDLAERCAETVVASILDREVVADLVARRAPEVVFHLAAVLSTKAEDDAALAHAVNVEGSLGLIGDCRELAAARGHDVRFLFPSSIAVYGLPDAATKRRAGAVSEHEWTFPAAIYGCNKLYVEMLGTYWTRQAIRREEPGLDFRCIRFPGLLSADTVPSGGTSDYGPEMIHAAAQDRPYASFVSPGSRLPFMTMPDAVAAFLRLAEADGDRLTTRVYNIRAFSPSADEFREAIVRHFPGAEITFEPVARRQRIVDSWPADVDDRRARQDWGLAPRHDLRAAIDDYLIPALRRRYAVTS